MDFDTKDDGTDLTASDISGLQSAKRLDNYTDGGVLIKNVGRVNPDIGTAITDNFRTAIKDASSYTVSSDTDACLEATGQISIYSRNTYVGEGVYTWVFEYNTDCGTAFSINSGYTGGTLTATQIDESRTRFVYSVETNQDTWIRIRAAASASFSINNFALYFTPTSTLDVTVISGNDNYEDQVITVEPGTSVTISDVMEELADDLPECIGFAKTSDGEMLSEDTVVTIYTNTTYYAIWGFGVTLDANDNSEFSDVTLSGFDTRNGVTVGDLISKIENNTERFVKGLSETADGELLDKDTVIKESKTLYIIWTVDESELGTLVFNIDFEKEGIEAPASTVEINDITDIYNSDLVPDGIKLYPQRLNSFNLVAEDGNTYYTSIADSDSRAKININEYENDFSWSEGTYTLVADVMTESAATISSDRMTVVDDISDETGTWNRISYTFTGLASNSYDSSGEPYCTLNFCVQVTGGTAIALDNIKLYFKTDETTVTVKNGGNNDITDVVANVSTTDGITVAELIEMVNEQETYRTLLGISETPTGELLDESTVIVPKYPIYLYAIWNSKSNNPYVDDELGHMLFDVDFENEAVINANWNGYGELDNVSSGTQGEKITEIASYYNPMLEGTNVRLFFRIDPDVSTTNQTVGIKTQADGNHFIEGTANHSNPKVQILNNEQLALENGIYTFYVDALSTGASSISHQKISEAGYTCTLVEGDTDGDGKWDLDNSAIKTYGLSFEITDGGAIPNGQVHFGDTAGSTVSFDNIKLYYKPFTATITIDPGDYPEFGTRTIEDVSTTGDVTGQYLVDQISADLECCGRDFLGLVDEYGDYVDLINPLVIPGDMTYTIVWSDYNDLSPETWEQTSIRYSTKEESRGIRFAADLTSEIAYDDVTTEYGWIITRESFLEDAGIAKACFTKDSSVKSIISGKNFGYEYDPDEDDGRKHFEETDENIVMTVVIYGVPAKYYNENFVVRPYIVYDGTTYYGVPYTRSIAEAAVAVRDAGYVGCDDELKAYIEEIIANIPAE